MVLSNDFQPIFSNLNEATKIAVVLALVFIVLSCVTETSPSTAKEVAVQISRHGHLTNAHLVYTKDGLIGLPFYVASNKSVKELFIPTDGTKMLTFEFFF